MSWFGEGLSLSSIKGQISNLTKEIVANNVVGLGSNDDSEIEENTEENVSLSITTKEKSHLEQLKLNCQSQDEEISKLKRDNERLRRLVSKQSARDRRVSEEATLECGDATGSSSQLPLVSLDEAGADSFLGQEQVPKDVKEEDEVSSLRSRLRKMFQEKVLMEQNCARLEKEVSLLTRQVTEDRQAHANSEARRNTESVCVDCHRGTQTETGASGNGNASHHLPTQDSGSLLQENDQLKRERAQMRTEIARLTRAIEDLESQAAINQDVNANLSTGMEELDIHHQEAIDQVLAQKDSFKKNYEHLLTEHDELKIKLEEVLRINAKLEQDKKTADQPSTSRVSPEVKTQVLIDLSEEIRNMITTEIPDKYFETSKKDASVLETVAAVEKMLSHTMSRVESSESKIKELVKELRTKDDELQELEDENQTLQNKIRELKEQCDNLPTIAEYNDVEVLENKIMSLENEVSVLREVRSNLEVEHGNSRSEIDRLIRQVQTSEAMLRNQDNLHTEISKYKEMEKDLMKKLEDFEHVREEMLSEINQLQKKNSKHDEVHEELRQTKLKLEEVMQSNNHLQAELLKIQEREHSLLKMSEELEVEKSLRLQVEEEKEKLFSELTQLETFEEKFTKQAEELQKEQSLRQQLKEENEELKQRIDFLLEADKNHAKMLENFQTEAAVKKELEESLEMMHGEVKRLEKDHEAQKELREKENIDHDLKLKEIKALNSCLSQKCVKFEKEIFDLTETSDRMKIEIDSKDRKLCEMILEKSVTDQDFADLKSTKENVESVLENFKFEIKDKKELLMTILNKLSIEQYNSKVPAESSEDIINYVSSFVQFVQTQCKSAEDEKDKLKSENLSLSEKITQLISEVSDKTNCIIKLTAQMETTEAEKHSLEDKLRNLNETVSTGNQTDQPDGPEVTLESYEEVKRKLEEQQAKCEELAQRYQTLLASSEQSVNQGNLQLQTLSNERQQLIETVQTKHSECLKYHSEIQRLCGELTKSEQQRTAAIAQSQKQLEEKEEAMSSLQTNSDRQVTMMTEQIQTLQNQLEYVSQLLRVTDRQEAEGQPASETTVAKTTSGKTELEDKEARLEELYETLQQEQLRNKYLQDEVSEQHEKEASLLRELERLRGHLVAVEDNYTQEMVKAEHQVQELNQRLSLAEDRAKSSSTAYTSASIRANQQVESLSSQCRLLTEQKERLQAQLAAAEDKLHKQAAALTNLQIVLEQFQRDKERDVASETERIRQTLQQANNKCAELSGEIKALQLQLKEAKEGLSAASRLTEQLDHKSRVISDLKQEVAELTDKLKKAEERIQAASMSVEGKVDRCLVRNLVVGYVSAPPSSQQQALSIIATVLDFTPDDRQRSGLDPNNKLSSLKQQTLSEAFVRFLENESRPQVSLRMPLQDTTEGSRSRKPSVSEVLPHARRTSGSVLKDVLKQDL